MATRRRPTGGEWTVDRARTSRYHIWRIILRLFRPLGHTFGNVFRGEDGRFLHTKMWRGSTPHQPQIIMSKPSERKHSPTVRKRISFFSRKNTLII